MMWLMISYRWLYNAGIPDKYDVGQVLTNDGAKGISTFMSYYIFKAMSESGHHKEAIVILMELKNIKIGNSNITIIVDR